MERSKPLGTELVVSTSSTVDMTCGHPELLQSPAIPVSLKTAASPSPMDCEVEEADSANVGLEQALQSFVRYAITIDLLSHLRLNIWSTFWENCAKIVCAQVVALNL